MKNMIHSMLHTQMFDNIVDQYNSFRESRSHEAGENSSFQQVNFQFVSGDDIEAFHRIEQQQRERAEKVMTRKDVARNAGEGHHSRTITEEDLLDS